MLLSLFPVSRSSSSSPPILSSPTSPSSSSSNTKESLSQPLLSSSSPSSSCSSSSSSSSSSSTSTTPLLSTVIQSLWRATHNLFYLLPRMFLELTLLPLLSRTNKELFSNYVLSLPSTLQTVSPALLRLSMLTYIHHVLNASIPSLSTAAGMGAKGIGEHGSEMRKFSMCLGKEKTFEDVRDGKADVTMRMVASWMCELIGIWLQQTSVVAPSSTASFPTSTPTTSNHNTSHSFISTDSSVNIVASFTSTLPSLQTNLPRQRCCFRYLLTACLPYITTSRISSFLLQLSISGIDYAIISECVRQLPLKYFTYNYKNIIRIISKCVLTSLPNHLAMTPSSTRST